MSIVNRKGPHESPEQLRELARRSRVIASAVPEPDRSRILSYANELERMASSSAKNVMLAVKATMKT
ncbi:MAG: hypothetical protein JSS04_06490 [Proteobacteria bacterium]|nr:hypothetical protein [Pseudomonadota bacterium]